ncbi:MAG: spore coat U domain-containing protein [Sulfurospirillaceae bacterium]|nr:spore coat U domain-containing protein [Sulfurospirillaceae bacterium]
MKKVLCLMMLFFGAISLVAGTTGGTVTVNGTAEQTCSITNSPALTLDFSGVSDATANFNVDIICNSGLNWTATIDGGGNPNGELRRAASGTDYITYRLYSDAGMTTELGATTANTITGTATGSTDTINVYAKVAMADNNPLPPAGTYSDTLNVTISW